MIYRKLRYSDVGDCDWAATLDWWLKKDICMKDKALVRSSSEEEHSR